MRVLEQTKIFILLCLVVRLKLSKGGHPNENLTFEQKLHKRLFNSTYYSTDLLPRRSHSAVIDISFGFELVKIVDVNAKEQTITVHAWVHQRWDNPMMSWNKSEFGGLDLIHVDSKRVWVPDIFLYNNNDDQERFAGGRSSFRSGVALQSNGTSIWNNPARFKTLCRINVKFFPFDIQECKLKMGSWMYNARMLNMKPMKDHKFPSQHFQANGEWNIYSVKMKRNEQKYQCCQVPYVDVTITIEMGRESMDYVINLILPCCLISSMIFLGFILPPESGERIGLSITVLLAMTVFQQLTSEIMPSYDFPILGQYYFAIILEIGASVVVTTTILNFYHRTNRKMPGWMRKLVMEWLAAFVLLTDTPEKRKILRRKSTRRSRRKSKRRICEDNGVTALSDECKDAHTAAFTVTFSDAVYSCGSTTSEGKSLEMENLGCSTNYRMNAFPFSNHEGLDDKSKEESRPYKDDADTLSEDELAIRHWEWTIVARILDRFFLIVAIICGIVTVAAIFLRAPKLWRQSPHLTMENPEPLVEE